MACSSARSSGYLPISLPGLSMLQRYPGGSCSAGTYQMVSLLYVLPTFSSTARTTPIHSEGR